MAHLNSAKPVSKLMQALRMKKLLLVTSVLMLAVLVFTFAISHKPVDFSTQVKPIINKHCITCHGGVKAKNNFSLLFRDEAFAKTKSGKPAIESSYIIDAMDVEIIADDAHLPAPLLKLAYKIKGADRTALLKYIKEIL